MTALLPAGVWTERRHDGNWHQCTGCSYLMGLAYSGQTFALGLNTAAERDAFQANAAESYPDADAAAATRYGRTLERSTVRLADLLTRVGIGVAVQGQNSRLAPHLHRWDPGYMGGHAVFCIPIDGHHLVQWYDPEAPDGYAGEPVEVSDVLRWAYGTPATYRVARPPTDTGVNALDPQGFTPAVADFTPGATLYDDPGRTHVHTTGWAGGTDIGVVAVDTANAHAFHAANVTINIQGAPPGTRQIVVVGADHMQHLRVRPGYFATALIPASPPPSPTRTITITGRDLTVAGPT